MRRRNFIRALAGGVVLPWFGLRRGHAADSAASFDHGVASGDPLADCVIIWTRVSGHTAQDIDVEWRIARDPGMCDTVNSGTARTGPAHDYTVKVDADSLPAGSTLYYQFAVGNAVSPVGRTRTLAAGALQSASFAVVSCANHPYGYFHAYREISMRDDIDAVIHLGDYIYEYGQGEYGTERAEELGRMPDPPTEMITLADVRRRHAQYKADPDLQALHIAHPMIAVWDDHELCNDSWRNGALDHNDDEDGEWPARRDAAIQAYLEWMPVRVSHERGHTKIFREFSYGDLLTLIMLDTRMYGRDLQPDVGDDVTQESIDAAMDNPDRRLLGPGQEDWLRDRLKNSGSTTWQVIGQQVMVTPTRSPNLEPLLDTERESMIDPELLAHYVEISKTNPPMLLDTWNGYPFARDDFLTDLYEYARNPVVLSGDLHTSMAGNLVAPGHTKPVAVEFMTGSVSSPGFAEYLPERRPAIVRDATLELNPELAYMETDRRGWLRFTVTHSQCTAEWHLIDTVHEQDYSSSVDRRLKVSAGRIGDGLQDA